MSTEKNYKKYLLAKVCVGTEPYVTTRLEMDIKDIIEYVVISRDEIDDHDVVKIITQSDDRDELVEHMNNLREADWYNNRW